MHEAPFLPTDGDRVQLRVVMGEIERELSCLGREAPMAEHQAAVRSLRASWSRLIELMAVGVAPLVRSCPVCGHTAMVAATRCGGCWISLIPWDVDRPASA
jgi:hypothetical protein